MNEELRNAPTGAAPPEDPEAFAESLRRRRQAAEGLERDLLTEVPMLYGSPDDRPGRADPGIVLARVHREEMVRRNGVEALDPSGRRSEVLLSFERATGALAVLLFLFLLFERLG